jgi:hypothetical protein
MAEACLKCDLGVFEVAEISPNCLMCLRGEWCPNGLRDVSKVAKESTRACVADVCPRLLKCI